MHSTAGPHCSSVCCSPHAHRSPICGDLCSGMLLLWCFLGLMLGMKWLCIEDLARGCLCDGPRCPHTMPHIGPYTQDKAAVLSDVRTIIAEQLGTDLDKVQVVVCCWMLHVVCHGALYRVDAVLHLHHTRHPHTCTSTLTHMYRWPPTPSLWTWVPTPSTR